MKEAFKIEVASARHAAFADTICIAMKESAEARGTGIGERSPEYIRTKMQEHEGIVATYADGTWAGFCYWDVYEEGKFVSNSGLIVAPEFRGMKLAEKLKRKLFRLCRKLFPQAKIFGITTGTAVMKVNSRLGFQPVAFEALPHDGRFWKGCQACKNHDVLDRTEGRYCLCTGMVFDPATKKD
ncbi:GNAT family N-acetyltransferase [Siphonobacter sp.]|uniref:GNAT family N-acetyltransferase n=1 Tax=Siphonobacter sp. TaxID=1869184 RepID=UPI003B3A0FD5